MFYVKRTNNEGAVINYNGVKYSSLLSNKFKILKNGNDFITFDSGIYEGLFKAFFTANYIYVIARRQDSKQDILIYNYNGALQKTINLEETNPVSSCACDSRSIYISFHSTKNCYEIQEQNIINLGQMTMIIKDNNYCYALRPSENYTSLVYLVDRGLTAPPTQYKELSLQEVIFYYSFLFNNLNVSKPCLSGLSKLTSVEKFIQINNDFSYSEEVNVDSDVDISTISSMFGDSGKTFCIEFFADVPNLYSAIKDDDNGIQIYEESSGYNITLKFDNDVVKTYTKTTDTILKAVRISLLGGSITANLTYSKGDTDSISTLEYANSYKYATSVTIGESTYNITDNVVEVNDLNISSDVEIKLNNGVIAYYDITFKNDTQLLQIKRTEENTLPVYEGETPTLEGKVFIGWTPEIYAVDKAQIYQATFKNEQYTIRFLDYNGSELEVKQVEYGVTPTYTGVTPSREGYTFTGWTPTLYPANKNQDYTATYTRQTFTIRFLDYNESVLETKQVEYDVTPAYTGTAPSREGYTFTGWTPALYPADKNQDYTAVYEKKPFTITIADSGSNNFSVLWFDIQSTEKTREFSESIISVRSVSSPSPYENTFTLNVLTASANHLCLISYDNKNVIPQQLKIGQTTYDIGTNNDIIIESDTTITIIASEKYLIRFLNYDNSVLETKYVYSGNTPTYTGDTPYQKGYTFTGWSPALYPANKNQDYVAEFSIQTFTIRFLNDDGSVLETKSVNYGVTPTYTGQAPTKEGYTFNGWSPTLYPANKNQDYTATYRNSAFALTLYKNSAENNKINKTDYLTSVGEITGYLRKETNIINPSIEIEYAGVIDFNYVYISTFNRYYFVTNITSVRTGLWRLDMKCDVLMTYKDTILNYECYVSRNENDYNKDIEDKYLPLEYEKVVDYIIQQDTTGVNPNFFKGFSALITTLATSPEVNLESENINITTPFNDLNGEPAKTNIYEAGSSNFKVVQMITDVGAYANCMNTIANALIQDDTKAGYVQSIIVYPIWNPAMYEQIGYKTMTDFYYGSEKLPLGGSYNVILKGDTIAPMKIATIYVSPKFNNFLDYDPYTTYEIWLPFHGWAKLPSEQVVGHYLNVYYVINTSSTKGTIIIRQETDSAVILEVDCTIGVEIPVSTTNGENVNRKIVSNGINLAIQGLGGTLMGMAGAVTGNPLTLFGGATMAMGAITGAISSGMTNRVEAQGKVSDGNAGLYSDKVVKIRRTSPTIAVDDISKYAKYIGRPLQTNVKLNTLTGYTIVGGVHIENLATATDNEKTDIENQLRKGVII